MGEEIERKFLVKGEDWKTAAPDELVQGYLCTDKERTVRVRTRGSEASLTIKGVSEGATRAEYEYSIPLAEARRLLRDLCLRPLIVKRRHVVEHRGVRWDVDEFQGANQGLVVAEVELEAEDQSFELPRWVGEEVTGDPRYFNSNLVEHPYAAW